VKKRPWRFGGHETFAIREGWLYKGLRLLREDPETYFDPLVSDRLGVGRNMAKSIWHWLRATGLIEKTLDRNRPPALTALGEMIWQHDPYFADPGTWWVLHANLCGKSSSAAAWYWFFNHFTAARFDKAQALDQCWRFLEAEGVRLPSRTTLNRDITCLLQSYAAPIPRSTDDPEEGYDCPFQDLELLLHYRDSGFYECIRTFRPIPGPIFGYVLVKAFGNSPYKGEPQGRDTIAVPLQEAAHAPGGPGRVFGLNQDALMTTILTLERGKWLTLESLAGDKRIVMTHFPPLKWLELYYMETCYRSVA